MFGKYVFCNLVVKDLIIFASVFYSLSPSCFFFFFFFNFRATPLQFSARKILSFESMLRFGTLEKSYPSGHFVIFVSSSEKVTGEGQLKKNKTLLLPSKKSTRRPL